jgi:hypothetical protein
MISKEELKKLDKSKEVCHKIYKTLKLLFKYNSKSYYQTEYENIKRLVITYVDYYKGYKIYKENIIFNNDCCVIVKRNKIIYYYDFTIEDIINIIGKFKNDLIQNAEENIKKENYINALLELCEEGL